MIEEVGRWVEEMKRPIGEYWELKQTAQFLIELEGDLNAVSVLHKKAANLFLGVIEIAKEIIDKTNCDCSGSAKELSDQGWGSGWISYQGLNQCDKAFSRRQPFLFGETSYTEDYYPGKIYELISKLIKTSFSNCPKDDELRKPWGQTAVFERDESWIMPQDLHSSLHQE